MSKVFLKTKYYFYNIVLQIINIIIYLKSKSKYFFVVTLKNHALISLFYKIKYDYIGFY